MGAGVSYFYPTWGMSWLGSWGNSWGPIEVDEERYSGGYGKGTEQRKEPLFFEYPEVRRTKELVSEDRKKFGVVLPEVAKAAIEVVSKVIEQRKDVVDEPAEIKLAEQDFRTELERLKVQWISEFSELIALEYERLEQENEDAQIAMLLFEM